MEMSWPDWLEIVNKLHRKSTGGRQGDTFASTLKLFIKLCD